MLCEQLDKLLRSPLSFAFLLLLVMDIFRFFFFLLSDFLKICFWNDDGNGKWKWDGKSWWFRVDHRGQVNSRIIRRRRDEEVERRTVSTQFETRMVGDREANN